MFKWTDEEGNSKEGEIVCIEEGIATVRVKRELVKVKIKNIEDQK